MPTVNRGRTLLVVMCEAGRLRLGSPKQLEAVMNQVTASPPGPTMSPEIAAFAAERGVSEYLPAVLAMTQAIYSGRDITIVLEDDPEIANDRHIVFNVDVTGLSVQQLVDTQWQWSGEIFKHCPSTHAPIF